MVGLLPLLLTRGPDAPRLAAARFARMAWPCFGPGITTGIWSLFAIKLGDRDTGYLTALLVELLLSASPQMQQLSTPQRAVAQRVEPRASSVLWPPSGHSSPAPCSSPETSPKSKFRYSCGRGCGVRSICWGNPHRNWGIPPLLLIRARHTCTMPPRRTRRGDPEPENRSANRNWGSGPGRGRRVENLGKPPKRVRGGPQPRWPREGPAVRPPAHGCRGRAGRRNVFGRTVGPSGRNPDRDRATAGHSATDG